MKCLLKLIQGLKTDEIHYVKDYYKIRSNYNSKRPILFNLIVANKIKSNSDAITMIYHGQSSAISTLSHLKKKLLNDLLNIILVFSSDLNGNKKNQQEFDCGKKLLQSEILMSRGLYDEGVSIINKTTKMADKYEFPAINLASHHLLMKYRNKTSAQSFDKKVEGYLNKYQNLINAKNGYHQGNYHNRCEQLVSNTASFSSKRVYYWNELSIIEDYKKRSEFEEAKDRAVKLLHYLQHEQCLKSNEKEAQTNRVLTEILLSMGDYHEALVRAKITFTFLDPCSPDYQKSLFVVFFSFLRSRHFSEAERIYKQAVADPDLNLVQANKWILLKGSLEFYQKKYKQVVNTIARCTRKYGKDHNWSLSCRLLELLTILEMKDYEWYEFRLDCYRKKMSKVRSNISDRMHTIFCLLQSLIKTNFDYDLLIEKEQEKLEELLHNKQEFYWDPTGYEIINIPNWILSKCSKFNFSDY